MRGPWDRVEWADPRVADVEVGPSRLWLPEAGVKPSVNEKGRNWTWMTDDRVAGLCPVFRAFLGNRGEAFGRPVPCKSWSCRRCSRVKVEETLARLDELTEDLEVVFMTTFEAHDRTMSNRLAQRLRRRKGSGVRITRSSKLPSLPGREPDGRSSAPPFGIIVSTCDLGGRLAPTRSDQFNPQGALMLLAGTWLSTPGIRTRNGVRWLGAWRHEQQDRASTATYLGHARDKEHLDDAMLAAREQAEVDGYVFSRDVPKDMDLDEWVERIQAELVRIAEERNVSIPPFPE